jgi:5-methylcytosine-specific restriction endonuclease McrA
MDIIPPSGNSEIDDLLGIIEAMIVEREEEYKIATEKYRQQKQDINDLAAEFLSNLGQEDQKLMASFLYWYSKIINATTIATACGIKSGQKVSKWVYPMMETRRCRQCGAEFKTPWSSRTSKHSYQYFCDTCEETERQSHSDYWEQRRAQVSALKAMPYSEYLKTEHWQETRRAALKRAKYRCQVCNTNDRSLHVHHRTYERRGEEIASDLIVLCESCHGTFHENGSLS